MANRIKIRRGSGIPANGSLQPYELGWDTTGRQLFIGGDSNTIKLVADDKSYTRTVTVTGAVTGTASTDQNTGITTVNVDWGTSSSNASFGGNVSIDGTLTTTGLLTTAPVPKIPT